MQVCASRLVVFTTNPNTGRRLRVFNPLITSPGHFSDRTFFVTPAVTRFSSLLSVINIDSLIVCLQIALLSFILLLCSGKLPLRLRVKSGVFNESYTTKKEEWEFPIPLSSYYTVQYLSPGFTQYSCFCR